MSRARNDSWFVAEKQRFIALLREYTEQEITAFAHGPEELDLVNSGLEETMIQAYHEIREIKKQHGVKVDLRVASMISAIDKIAITYQNRGIFP